MKLKNKIKIAYKILKANVLYWDFSLKKILLRIFLLMLIIIAVISTYRTHFLLENNKRYTIGNIYYIKSGVKGSFNIYYSISVKKSSYYTYEIFDSYNKNIINKQFFVKFYPEDPYLSRIMLNCPVPDSIKEAPPEGWEKLPCKCNE